MRAARRVWIVAAAGVVAAGAVHAAVTAPPGSRESLIDVESIQRWSIGIDFQREDRKILKDHELLDLDNQLTTAEWSLYLGYRPLNWLTIFGQVGTVDFDLGLIGSDHDYRFGGGLQASLWQYDMKDPEFLSGRYSVRGLVEYAYAQIEDDVDDGNWGEFNASLLLNYEIFVETIETAERMPYSLSLYVGPILSLIDGEVQMMGEDVEFEEDSEWGVVMGFTLSISHNFALDFSIQQFDDSNYRGGFRYNF